MDEPHTVWVFCGFRLDARSRHLLGPDGSTVPIKARAFDVLVHLVLHADRVVSKSELMEAVWQDRVVEENNLTQAVSSLRRVLGGERDERRLIATVPGRGYRFVAEVSSVPAASLPAARPVSSWNLRWSRPWRLGGVLAMTLVALAWIVQRDTGVAGPRPESAIEESVPTLAILPFRALAGDPEDELLALGLAETLITRLSPTDRIRVRSVASSERAATAAADPLASARALGARYVVHGSTQRNGTQVRVNVRLEVPDERRTLWAETYDTELSEVFTLQDTIAVALARTLSIDGVAEVSRTSPCDGSDAEAYRAYLAGHHLIQSPSPSGLRRAVASFRRALDLDPTCARAWAGLAFAWRGLSITGNVSPVEAFALSRAAVVKALELDPDLGEAYASLGFIQFWHDWDWAAAEVSLRHAITLAPSLAEARMAIAHLYSNLGRFDEALKEAARARELDPLSPLVNTLEASFMRAAGRHVDAEARIGRALELAPEFWLAFVTHGEIALSIDDAPSAVVHLQRAADISGGATQALALLGVAYVANQQPEQARALLTALEARAANEYVPPTVLATLHNALGEEERALDRLEQAYRERDLRLAFLKTDSRWDNLRGQARFMALAAHLDLQ